MINKNLSLLLVVGCTNDINSCSINSYNTGDCMLIFLMSRIVVQLQNLRFFELAVSQHFCGSVMKPSHMFRGEIALLTAHIYSQT